MVGTRWRDTYNLFHVKHRYPQGTPCPYGVHGDDLWASRTVWCQTPGRNPGQGRPCATSTSSLMPCLPWDGGQRRVGPNGGNGVSFTWNEPRVGPSMMRERRRSARTPLGAHEHTWTMLHKRRSAAGPTVTRTVTTLPCMAVRLPVGQTGLRQYKHAAPDSHLCTDQSVIQAVRERA